MSDLERLEEALNDPGLDALVKQSNSMREIISLERRTDAARRFANLTSPETIEKALPEIHKLLHGYDLHLNDYAAKELTESMVRIIAEDEK